MYKPWFNWWKKLKTTSKEYLSTSPPHVMYDKNPISLMTVTVSMIKMMMTAMTMMMIMIMTMRIDDLQFVHHDCTIHPHFSFSRWKIWRWWSCMIAPFMLTFPMLLLPLIDVKPDFFGFQSFTMFVCIFLKFIYLPPSCLTSKVSDKTKNTDQNRDVRVVLYSCNFFLQSSLHSSFLRTHCQHRIMSWNDRMLLFSKMSYLYSSRPK